MNFAPSAGLTTAAAEAPPLRIVAVVVTYNRMAQLRVTLSRLSEQPLDHILVVDNASTDGTADWLATLHNPAFTVLRLAENTGGAGGFEAGLRAVTERFDPDWTVLLDDDARPLPGALAAFRAEVAGLDPLAREATGVIAAAVFLPQGDICEMNRPSRNPFWHPVEFLRTVTGRGHRGFHLEDRHFAADAPPVAIDVASFVGFFVSRAAVALGGLPEGGLFIYGDDVIYSLRLRRLGIGIAMHPAVRFEHDCGSLGTGLVTRPLWKVYYLCRNGIALARMAAGPLLYPVALLWYLAAWWRKARHYTPAERPLYRSLMREGVRDGLKGLRGRKDAIHDRVAREEHKVALPDGRPDRGRPVAMTTPAELRASPPVLAAVSAPAPQLAAPQPAARSDNPAAPPSAVPPGKPAPGKPAPAKSAAAKTPKGSARAVAVPARSMPRHRGLLIAFVVIVILPVMASAFYLYTRAVDQYASTLGFTVRSEDVSSASDFLGGLGSSLGVSGSRDSDILYEFLRSQELVSLVDARLDLHSLYSRHVEADPLMGFDPEGTIEDLVEYWQRMVRISYDAGAGLVELRVLAFDAAEAKAIAEVIYDESSKMINALSAIAREDATRYAREDLDAALERLKNARESLTAFRISNRIVDPVADIQGQMGLLSTLQSQLANTLIELDLLIGTAPPEDPRILQAQRRIAVIEQRIDDERRKFGPDGQGPGGENYAVTVGEFERLMVDTQFAEQAYTVAMAAYDGARAEANRQSRYLAAYIRPTLAQKSEFPQREVIVGLVALFSFLIWSILSLVYYALRDRR